ncbi:M81 family metallopeptidase [Paenibacillus sp. TH7-28]
MKVLVGSFNAESNASVKKPCGLNDFVYKFGDEMIDEMKAKDLFEQHHIELVPTIYANGYAQGLVTKEAFDFISSAILQGVKENIHELDGIYLFLHGGSYIKDLEGGSGEHYLLREIRKITGPYFPIAVVMDPHGNVSEELVSHSTIVRCYRQSPHTDIDETYRHVAKLFIELLNNRKNIKPVYRRVPILLGGERCVSTDEPLLSINKVLDKVEASPEILSVSYYIGYTRHDNYTCGAGVVVIPSEEEHTKYAETVAEEIADYAFSKRKEFHFTGNAMEPEEALQTAIEFEESPVIISDSGDNTTAGASGQSTFVLRQLLKRNHFGDKKILISAITDTQAVSVLSKQEVGQKVDIELGAYSDLPSQQVSISGEIVSKGYIRNLKIFGSANENVGEVVTLRLNEYPIDVAVSNKFVSYAEMHQFAAANLDIHAYDIIVVKQGYIFPELNEISKLSIMSLTPGETYQYTEKIPYKRILRPMFPIDDI